MLSIIISSYQPQFYKSLEKNISETIGIPYEIVKIDNPGIMGICKAYNIGANKSKFENLLFLHEDVFFCNENWGVNLIQLLSLPNCGVIGVAGGSYYSHIPASWWNKGYNHNNFIQIDDKNKEIYNNNLQSEYVKVKGIDGVFLSCKKSIYKQFTFDEELTGFHGYDLIFSLKIAKEYSNYITNKVLLKHFSTGNLSKEWLENILIVRKKVGVFNNQIIDRKTELRNFYQLIFLLKKHEKNKKKAIIIALRYINLRVHGFINTLKMIRRMKHLI